MSYASTINPFFAARMRLPRFSATTDPYKPVFAKLPRVPINASPVPTLTSLYHNSKAGDYGDRGYPGNCGGNLIRDLLLYFRSRRVFDPLCCAAHNGSSVAPFVMWS